MEEKVKKPLYLAVFSVLIVIFAVLSKKIGFHDVGEYITFAKALAGINNVDLFVGHPMLYPWFISFFLKISQSFTAIRVANVIWVILISITLYYLFNDKKAFLLFALSPLTWFAGTQTTPILPAAFLFTLSFYFFKKSKIKYNQLISGFILGLSCAVYTPMIIAAFFFTLIYFWNKQLKETIIFGISMFMGFIPGMVFDYLIFGNPIYSLIRYASTNLLITLNMNSNITQGMILSHPEIFLLIIFISPFLFRLHKLKFKENKNEILLLLIVGAFYLLRGGMLKYFIILSPIAIILLSKCLSKKEIKINLIISAIIIMIIAFQFISDTSDVKTQEDINNIIADYKPTWIIAEPYNSIGISTFVWGNEPKVTELEIFNSVLEGKDNFKEYSFLLQPTRVKLRDNVEFTAKFKVENISYDNYIFVSKEKQDSIERFNLDKCYSQLCVYKD
jgi:hypothetical protein